MFSPFRHKPTSGSTRAHSPVGQRYHLAIEDRHQRPAILEFARLRQCRPADAVLFFDLSVDKCRSRAACADGRLPFDDERALPDAQDIDYLGRRCDVLRDAVASGIYAMRWNHLWVVDFQRIYPCPQAHRAAKRARQIRDADRLREASNKRSRLWKQRQRADILERRAAEHWPSRPPAQPLRVVPAPSFGPKVGVASPVASPLSGSDQNHQNGHKSSHKRPNGENVLPGAVVEIGPSRCDVTVASKWPPPEDGLKQLSDGRSSKSSPNMYLVSPASALTKAIHPPLPPLKGAKAKGCGQVRPKSGVEPPTPRQLPPPTIEAAPICSEGVAISDSPSPEPLAALPNASAGQDDSDRKAPPTGVDPQRFGEVIGRLSLLPFIRKPDAEAAQGQLGPDYAPFVEFGGERGVCAFNDLPAEQRSPMLQAFVRKHRAAWAARENQRAASPPGPLADTIQRILGASGPTNGPPPPPSLGRVQPPPRDRTRMAPRQRGEERELLPDGAVCRAELRAMIAEVSDLPMVFFPLGKMLRLHLSPERAGLAIKEAAGAELRNPQRLGVVALRVMERMVQQDAEAAGEGGLVDRQVAEARAKERQMWGSSGQPVQTSPAPQPWQPDVDDADAEPASDPADQLAKMRAAFASMPAFADLAEKKGDGD